MATNLFVGGLPYETTQDEVARLFASCGTVTSVKIIMDRDTGRSKGFGFVEMASEAEAQTAIKKLNGSTLGQRTIFINEARPQEKRPGGFVPKPGFVERRSGKDRRRQPGGASEGERRDIGDKKPYRDKKPWEKMKPQAEKKSWGNKPKGFEGKKKWGPAGPGGGKKWGVKPKRFGTGFGGGKFRGRGK